MILSADALACRRAGRLVFEGVSFRVRAGEAATLRGPNGSGKSSLLRILAGLLPPIAGAAHLDALSLTGDGEAWRERIALAGHLDAIKPALTVRENLVAWAVVLGGDPAGADAALERFGLSALADDPARWCSAGQKRRLGLARLLVAGRPVWLLDEPTVSLDAESTAVFAGAVADHCAAGGLALAATHIPLGLTDGPEIMMPARVERPGAAGDVLADDAGGPRATDDPFLTGGWG